MNLRLRFQLQYGEHDLILYMNILELLMTHSEFPAPLAFPPRPNVAILYTEMNNYPFQVQAIPALRLSLAQFKHYYKKSIHVLQDGVYYSFADGKIITHLEALEMGRKLNRQAMFFEAQHKQIMQKAIDCVSKMPVLSAVANMLIKFEPWMVLYDDTYQRFLSDHGDIYFWTSNSILYVKYNGETFPLLTNYEKEIEGYMISDHVRQWFLKQLRIYNNEANHIVKNTTRTFNICALQLFNEDFSFVERYLLDNLSLLVKTG